MDNGPVNCIICENKELFEKLNIENLTKCSKCQSVFRSPRPSPEEVYQCYEEKYFATYLKESTGNYRVKLYKKFLKRISGRKPKGRLLDIGCSFGQFITLAHEKGWDVHGIEPSKEASEYIKKKYDFDISSSLIKRGFPSNHFDIITLWNVLDHLPDPKKELVEIQRVLKPGGLLFLRIPNFLFQKRAFQTASFFGRLSSPRSKLSHRVSVFHLYCFTPATIKKLLNLSGFESIITKNSLLSEGDSYSAFPTLGDKSINLIKNLAFILFETIYHLSLKSLVWGPSMEVYSTKSSSHSAG